MKWLYPSMTVRLTVTFGLIAIAVFAGAGVLIYKSLVEELRRADHEELSGKFKAVLHFVDEAAPEGSLTALAHHLDDVLIGHDHLRVWLLSDKGEPVYGGFPLPVVLGVDEQQMLTLALGNGQPLVGVKQSVSGAASMNVHEALVAIDLRPRLKLLASYRNTLAFICILGVVLALGLGAVATRRGLLPVKRLSKAADQISPDSLVTRLPSKRVDFELVDMTRAFNSALDRVERAYRHQEAFNANVAHELRTPLNTLINGAQVTLSGERTVDALRETLASNLEELERLKSIVNDMLFLAKADQGEKALSLEKVELADEVQKSIDYFDPILQEANVAAVCDGRAECRCNPPLIRRALVNLLSNAVKHTASGGTVTVHIQPGSTTVRVAVTNPGAPLSAHVAEHMFDRFFRADEARVQAGESTGLGLAIVKAVARMHDGDVFAESSAAGVTVGFEITR